MPSDRGAFSGNPVVEFSPNGRTVRVWGVAHEGTDGGFAIAPLIFTRPNGETVTVEPGFICDGLSQPWLLWSLKLSPFTGRSRDGALIHDWLYNRQHTDDGPLTRAEADTVFYEAMRARGTSWFVRKAKYYAVRWFSSGGWRPRMTIA